MSPGKSRITRWRETEDARFDQYLIDSFYTGGDNDAWADRPVRVIYGARRLTDEFSERAMAAALFDQTPLTGAAGAEEFPEPTAASPAADPCEPGDLLDVADADAMDFSALRARARNALIGNPRAKLDDADSPQVAADPEETAVNGPKTASTGKSPDLTWGHFALGLAVGTVAGVGLLALVGSFLSYL